MISKQEFANVVAQINGRFDWFTNKVNELQSQIDQLNPDKDDEVKTQEGSEEVFEGDPE